MQSLMENLLGSSWRTSLAGLVSGICSFLAFYPEILDPLPEYWENTIRQLLAFLIGVGMIQIGRNSRDVKESEKTTKSLEKEIEKIKYEKF